MIPYYMRKGEFRPARLMFDTLEKHEPGGEATRMLRDAVEGSYLLEAARKLASFALRRERLPRKFAVQSRQPREGRICR
jgi:hypothetical protein